MKNGRWKRKTDTHMGQCFIPFKQNGHGLYQYTERRRGLVDHNLFAKNLLL
jgi:hypothetical protein